MCFVNGLFVFVVECLRFDCDNMNMFVVLFYDIFVGGCLKFWFEWGKVKFIDKGVDDLKVNIVVCVFVMWFRVVEVD